MQWTDRIRQVKILLVVSAIIIAGASLLISHYLVRDLQVEETSKMEVWAQAMNAFNNADETTDLSLVTSVIESNNTIPVIVMDREGNVADWRNIKINGKDFPMSVWKDLSAIHYVDDSPGYYERSDIAFEFQSDGSLTMTETYNRERDGSNPNVSVYHIVYENGLPVSCPDSKVAVTYDDKGLPATLSVEDGAKTWTFLGHPRVLLAATMKEPKAQGLVACFWANYSYDHKLSPPTRFTTTISASISTTRTATGYSATRPPSPPSSTASISLIP